MEGPSLYLAEQQLKAFKGKIIKSVSGNTTLDKTRFQGQKIKDIFSWGKHLVFQFDHFAIRIHFLLFGTFEARVFDKWVTGDYRKPRSARLSFLFETEKFSGEINTYNCSIKFLETGDAKKMYDFSVDIMSKDWNPLNAYKKIKDKPNAIISDILLDQDIFAGVGNIIKNEVLFLTQINPNTKIENISPKKIKQIISFAQSFSFQFYKWRKKFVLRKNLLIYKKGACPHCGEKITRKKIGKFQRITFFCPSCQSLK